MLSAGSDPEAMNLSRNTALLMAAREVGSGDGEKYQIIRVVILMTACEVGHGQDSVAMRAQKDGSWRPGR